MREREHYPAFLWTNENTFIRGEVIKERDINQWDFVIPKKHFPFLTKNSIIEAKDILIDMSRPIRAKEGDEWYPE